jgi:hypothetical protein
MIQKADQQGVGAYDARNALDTVYHILYTICQQTVHRFVGRVPWVQVSQVSYLDW